MDRVPALACLIERMHDREAIEAVILEVNLTHSLVGLAGKRHIVAKFTELLEHEILVGCLLIAHSLEYGLVCQLVCHSDVAESSVLMLLKALQQLSHHKTESDHALGWVLAFLVHFVDAVGCGDYVFHVVLGVELFVG